jgi:hypothetical protein
MGLLEELRAQASDIQAGEEKERKELAENEAFYQKNLRPGMLKAYQYLNDLVTHINIVKPECIVEYPLMPDGQGTIPLHQSNYKVLIDSSSNPKKIDIRFHAQLEESVSLNVHSKSEIARYSDYLDRYGLKYHRKDEKNDQYEITNANFLIQGPLPIQIRIFADLKRQRIEIISKNFRYSGIEKTSISPENLDGQLLDRVGKFILRKVDAINSSQISEQALANIRKKLKSEKALAESKRIALEVELEAEPQNENLNAKFKSAVIIQKSRLKNIFKKKSEI